MQTDCFPDAIPDWSKAPVSRLAQVNPRYPVCKDREYPFIEMAAVGQNFAGIISLGRRRPEGSGLTRFKVGDTLFAKITPCPENGKVAFVESLPDGIGLGSTEFIVLSPKEGCDRRFLYHLLCAHDVRGRAVARMEGSTGRQRVPEEVFVKRLLVPIPEPAEQAAIARLLDSVDTAIKRSRDAIKRARALHESLINQLLRTGIRGKEQKKSGAGLIPLSWSCEPLGQHIADGPTNGIYRPESDYGSEGTRIVRIDSFDDGRIHGIAALRRVNVKAVIQCRYALTKGDILINRVNSLSHIGKAAIVPTLEEPTLFESNMMSLRCDDQLLPDFLILVLCSDIARKHWLARAKPAVNQASINQRDVRELLVPLPDPDEQREIFSIVNASSVHLDNLSAVADAQLALKNSLMHDLLTGRVRVKGCSVWGAISV